jgi:hypothetical protein
MTEYFFSAVDSNGVHATISFETDNWLEILDNFVLFLRGKGFYVSDDSIGVNLAKHYPPEDTYYNFTTFNSEEQE